MVAIQPRIITNLTGMNAIRRGMAIRGIVLHDTAGSGRHNDTLYLAKPGDGRKVGVDYTIERDGNIYKLTPGATDTEFCMPHAGRNTAFAGQVNGRVNRVTIGIELVQHVGLALAPIWPTEQVHAAAKLCAWLVTQHNLVAADIVTHRQIVTDGSRSDPRQFPFSNSLGFWHLFWLALGREAEYLRSLNPEQPKTGPVQQPVDEPRHMAILRLDARGSVNDPDDVKLLQKSLARHLVATIDADGIFGPATQRFVRQFQVREHLTPDGVVGPATWTRLLA